MTLFNDTGAMFSPDRKYRYVLWRKWNLNPNILFIGLNPSTGDESQNDRTLKRVINFANSWGYGGIYMANLFAWVSKHPEDLLTCPDPVCMNDEYLTEAANRCKDVLFAWGGFEVIKKTGRDLQIIQRFPNALCLKKKYGRFAHPSAIRERKCSTN